MRRRDFLKTTLTAAGALIIGVRCGTDTDAGSKLDVSDGSALFPQSVASGDPRPDGGMLWTRVVAGDASADTPLLLEVSKDKSFSALVKVGGKERLEISAAAKWDHCIKVRLTGLAPATGYFYRFLHLQGTKHMASRTGHIKTAPTADADAKVRFAVASCQDFNGKYYNTYRRMLAEDLDFFVHLGDYVYETTGNTLFQDKSADRAVSFTDKTGAITLEKGTDNEHHAARSLDNYRELYRTYRGDKDLQAMHEKVAMVVTWDDHEFSDDCWGENATYHDGKQVELDPERRRNADQAWFEYMPVDYLDQPDFEFDPKAKFPDNLRIYRDLQFGKHLHLAMTDARRYRSDHLVPEDAFPGAVMLTEANIKAVNKGEIPASATGYVDIEKYEGGKYVQLMKDAAKKLGWFADEDVKGLMSAEWINLRIADLNKDKKDPDKIAPIAADAFAKMKLGFAYHHLLKTGRYSALGSRYLVVEEPFRLLSAHRFAETKGKSELGLGDTQRKWLLDTFKASKATWKIWGNEYCVTPRVADLRGFDLPDAFKARFLLSAEDWDGMPVRRDEILAELAKLDNVVAVTGDIHAFFAGTPWVHGKPDQRIVEFVTGAISSGTYKTLLMRQAGADPTLVEAGALALAAIAEEILLGNYAKDKSKKPNPWLGYAKIDEHGFMVMQADGKELSTTFVRTPGDNASKDLGTGDALTKAFSTDSFKVVAGASNLYKESGGKWLKWHHDKSDWGE